MNRKAKLAVCALVSACCVAVGVALAASSPSVATGSATSITTSSAVLNGTVNPNGATTTYRFEYGLTTSYGVVTAAKSAGSGTKSLAEKTTVKGLLPGTVYHYRIDASNRFGTTVGHDRTFKTSGNPPPDAATGPATQVHQNDVTLTAVINPHGETTQWAFQYGLTSAYGVQTFGGSVPAGSAAVAVAEKISGLQSGTTFHYRVLALHGATVVQYGSDATFVTLPSPRPSPRIAARTTPGRARSAPFVFTTSGRLILPRSIPSSVGCAENVAVSFFLGRRVVGASLLPVQPDCKFSGQTTFNHKPGRGAKNRHVHLEVVVQYRGSSYLKPRAASRRVVTLG